MTPWAPFKKLPSLILIHSTHDVSGLLTYRKISLLLMEGSKLCSHISRQEMGKNSIMKIFGNLVKLEKNANVLKDH